MKALITGSAGFIGSQLCAELERHGYELVRCDLRAGEGQRAMDILDAAAVRAVIAETMPDVLINMAGQANVALSWKKPQLTVALNTIGLINILEAVRELKPSMRVVAVGSSDEYGSLAERGVNVTEDIPIRPITPYAISKEAQEHFAQLYLRAYGLNICMLRLFNLGGPQQGLGYMISDFASGVAAVEAGQRETLSVGNLDSARDFTHVADAARACRLIAEKGRAGEIYNVCSGVTYTAREVLDRLLAMAEREIPVVQDPARMRPSDTPVVCGNHDKLTAHTGWVPEKSMDDTLRDSLAYWRAQAAAGLIE